MDPQSTPSPAPLPTTPPNSAPSIPKSIKPLPLILVSLALIVLISSILIVNKIKPKSSTSSPNLYTTGTLSQNLPEFATYVEETVSATPVVPQSPIKIEDLTNLSSLETSLGSPLTAPRLQALLAPGFFTLPAPNKYPDPNMHIETNRGSSDEFINHYQDIGGKSDPYQRSPENTLFISSDFLLHSYHVFLDRTFQHIEQTNFQPHLLSLSQALLDQMLTRSKAASSDQIKTSYDRLSVYFLVPTVLLSTTIEPSSQFDPETGLPAPSLDEADLPENIQAKLLAFKDKVPPHVYSLAEAEIALISKSEGITPSPLFGQFIPEAMDYSQFKPRSHYQKNSLLRSYWRAMIWYGRSGFLLSSPELTQDAALLTLVFQNTSVDSQPALSVWESIYLPTVFFVGKSDDLTFYDLSKVIADVYGSSVSDAALLDPQKLSSYSDALKALPGPLIQSSAIAINPEDTKEETLQKTKGFRFMGQRFTPDSFIFSSLTQGDEAPDPVTGQKFPSIPTSLMAFTAMSHPTAEKYLADWIQTNAPDSDKVLANKLAELKSLFTSLPQKEWTSNIYWSWFYALNSLSSSFGPGYPPFMQTSAWQDKSLNTVLGSWTELRHDTLLYAKQSYAELGGGVPDEDLPPVPKGYVEPNLTFLNRLIALAKLTKQGLENQKVLSSDQSQRLDTLIKTYTFYRDLAVKQLQNQTISDEDFERLRIQSIYNINFALTPLDSPVMSASEVRSGIIADVHTDVPGNKVLYEATGIPQILVVAVSDANGTRLTRGLVYSHYEFTHPVQTRLSDSDWQAVIYESGQAFPKPSLSTWASQLEK